MKNKFKLYEEYGVKEYWIITPLDEIVYIHTLENGKYKGAAHRR
ncbi:Uma2 family endonuclease [Riemerella anatipestifer]